MSKLLSQSLSLDLSQAAIYKRIVVSIGTTAALKFNLITNSQYIGQAI